MGVFPPASKDIGNRNCASFIVEVGGHKNGKQNWQVSVIGYIMGNSQIYNKIL